MKANYFLSCSPNYSYNQFSGAHSLLALATSLSAWIQVILLYRNLRKNKIIESLFENNNQLKWLHFIRKEEVETALEPFSNKKNNNILDIGGNDGFIANYISNKGYKITSIDQNLKNPQYFPVRKGNAEELDFKNNEFDIIFLSHTIAHIKNKELLFKECKRVLKENGVIIGIVPSGWWSLVTNFWHYVLLPKTLIKFILNLKESKQNIDKSNVNNYNGSKIKRIIISNRSSFYCSKCQN